MLLKKIRNLGRKFEVHELKRLARKSNQTAVSLANESVDKSSKIAGNLTKKVRVSTIGFPTKFNVNVSDKLSGRTIRNFTDGKIAQKVTRKVGEGIALAGDVAATAAYHGTKHAKNAYRNAKWHAVEKKRVQDHAFLRRRQEVIRALNTNKQNMAEPVRDAPPRLVIASSSQKSGGKLEQTKQIPQQVAEAERKAKLAKLKALSQ